MGRKAIVGLGITGAALGALRFRTPIANAWRHRAAARERWAVLKPAVGGGGAELRRALRDASNARERWAVLSNTAVLARGVLTQLFAPPDPASGESGHPR